MYIDKMMIIATKHILKLGLVGWPKIQDLVDPKLEPGQVEEKKKLDVTRLTRQVDLAIR